MGRLPLFLASVIALAGCSAIPGAATSSRLLSVHGQVNLTAQAAVAKHAYKISSLYQAYTWTNLDHVSVYLLDTTSNGSDPAPDYAQADSSSPFTVVNGGSEAKLGDIKPNGDGVTVHVGNLKADHTYAVRIEAWQVPASGGDAVRADDATSPDNITHISLMKDNVANSNVTDCDIADYSVENRGFKLKLADQTFSGQASGDLTDNGDTVTVENGGLSADDTVSPSISVGGSTSCGSSSSCAY